MGREGSRQSGVDKGRARARLYARLGRRRRRRPRAGGIVREGIGRFGASRPVSMTGFPPVLKVTGPRGADCEPGGSGPGTPRAACGLGTPSLRRSGVRRHHRPFPGFPGLSARSAPRPQWNRPRPSPASVGSARSGPAAAARSPAPCTRRPVPGGSCLSLPRLAPRRSGSAGFSRIPGAPPPIVPKRGGGELGWLSGYRGSRGSASPVNFFSVLRLPWDVDWPRCFSRGTHFSFLNLTSISFAFPF